MSVPSLLMPYGYSSSTCGYCTPVGSRSHRPSSKKYGLEAPQMSCQFYQNMIDRGWRRSGDYVYHPDMARSCCPQYTIRLDAKSFKPGKKHRQVINRFNRFLSTGSKPGEGGSTESNGHANFKGKGKGKANDSWVTGLREFGLVFAEEGKHPFRTELTPAKATSETFELYKRYQMEVHNDPPGKVTIRGFQRFLCDSPLVEATIQYAFGAEVESLPKKYGSYHLLYRVDNKLVGISVIDILPHCVSSVYFIWDPDWAWASLGKLSALREIALVLNMAEAGAKGMEWLYMGYWIPDRVKMRYKSEYGPSYLLDPGTNIFHLLSEKVDKYLQAHPRGYHPFAEIETWKEDTIANQTNGNLRDGEGESQDMDMEDVEKLNAFPSPPPPGFGDPLTFDDTLINQLLVSFKGSGTRRASRVVRLTDLAFQSPELVMDQVKELVAAIGVNHMAFAAEEDSGRLKDKGVLYFG